ncbi:zonadhesin isoform X2 [Tamandua tetradactyla]|uniref:zonadhesin isoform X2 n=1 Tax=Tamandua tetradactyla TaxID=48850 RepID=UPI004053AC73
MAPPVWTLVLLVGAVWGQGRAPAPVRKEKPPDWKPVIRKARDNSVLTQCDFEDDYNPFCGWTQESGDDGNWTRTKGANPDDITRPQGGYPDGEGSYLHVDSPTISSGGVVALSSPILSDTGPLCVHFAYHMFGRSWGAQLKLLLLPGAGGSPRQLLWKQTNTQSTSWMPATITVPAGIVSPSRLMFEAVRGKTAYLDISLDAISVRRGSCDQVCVMQTCSFDVLNDFCGWSWVPTATGARWIQKTGPSGQWQVGPEDDFSIPGKGQEKEEAVTPEDLRSQSPKDKEGSYLLLDPKDAKPEQKAVLLSPLSQSPGCLGLTFRYILRAQSPGAGLQVFAKVLGSIRKHILFSGIPGPSWQPVSVKFTGQGEIQFIIVGVFGVIPEPAVAVDAIGIAPCGESFPQCDFEDDARPFCDWIQVSGDGGHWSRGNRSASAQGPPKGEHHYIYLEADKASQAGKSVQLVSWPFCASEVICVEFSYHMFGLGEGPTLQLLLGSPGGTTSDTLWSRVGSQSPGWLQASVTIPSGHQQPMQLILEAITGTSTTFEVAVGFISIRHGTCSEPMSTVLPTTEKPTIPMEGTTFTLEKPSVPTEKPTIPTEKPTVPTEKPTVPTEKSTIPTTKSAVSIEKPTTPSEKPSIPTEKPTTPTEKPTIPTEKPTIPTAKSTIPTEKATIPTEKPTVPTTKPTVPTEKSTVPTEKPTVPTEKPTVPTEKPTVPIEGSTIPTEKSTVPMEKSTVPMEKSPVTTEKSTVPTERSTVPTERSTIPTERSAISMEKSTVLTEEPTIPITKPTIPTEEPTIPTEKPTVSTEKSTVSTTKPTIPTEKPTIPTEEPTVSTEKSTVSTTKPTIPTEKPTVSTEKPTVSTTKPTISTEKPTVPTTKATVPTKKPTIPTEKLTVPTVKPAVPSEKPTVPTVKPIVPTEKPTVPTTKPIVPTEKPTVPTMKPTVPTMKPTVPTEKPTVPTMKPTVPTEKPPIPTIKPTVPMTKPTVPTEKPTIPTEKPPIPTMKPTVPTTKPTIPKEKPTVPIEKPSIPTEKPAVPTEKPTIPTTKPTVPTTKSTVPTIKPTVPTTKPPIHTVSTTKPSIPTTKSTVPTTKPPIHTVSTTKPPVPTTKSTVPTIKPTVPTVKPTVPTIKPTVPTMKPTAPTTKSTVPAIKPTVPTMKPIIPTTKSTVPTTKPPIHTVPTMKPTVPTAKPTVPTMKRIVPTTPTIPTTKPTVPTTKHIIPTVPTTTRTIPTVPTTKRAVPTLKPTIHVVKPPGALTPPTIPTLQPIGPAVWAITAPTASAKTNATTRTTRGHRPPVSCPPQSHYESCACHATCQHPKPHCEIPCRPSCVCNPGFLLSGYNCIKASDCSCHYNNTFYKPGEEWFNHDCSEYCSCVGKWATCHASQCGAHRVCQEKNGRFGCYPQGAATCVVYGDLHYLTFDRKPLTILGKCTYILIQSSEESTVPHFRVTAKTEERGRDGITCLSKVSVTLSQVTITLLKGRHALVEGQRVTLPAMPFQGIFLFLSGRFLELQTAVGLRVRWDGDQQLFMTVPGTYFSKLSGICGNFDGQSNNDNRKPDGHPARDEKELGNSWQTKDKHEDKDTQCQSNQGTPPSCDKTLQDSLPGPQLCGQLIDPQGPFEKCLPHLQASFYYKSCLFDMCSFQGLQQILCVHMAALTEACQAAGHMVKLWRSPQFCPLACPSNSKYALCAKSCPKTCYSRFSVPYCPNRCVEGCECTPGFFLGGLQCVPDSQCGCEQSTGRYHLTGDDWYLPECKERCYCDKNRQIKCMNSKCEPPYNCVIEDGVYGCHTEASGICTVSGDPHVQTFDGALHHFMGSCTYTLTHTCWYVPPEASFLVHITGEFRGGNLTTSYVRIVHVQVFNIKFKLLRRLKVMMNGHRMALPLWAAGGRVSVGLSGSFVLLRTDFGLWIRYDGFHLVEVTVPYRYMGRLCGLCGNFNKNRLDDNKDPKNKPTATSAQLTAAWMARELSEPGCFPVGGKPPSCPGSIVAKTWTKDCEILINPRGPFSQCHGLVSPHASFDSCVYGQCGTKGDPISLCRALQTYATLCAHAGQPLSWRNRTFCSMRCPTGSSYSPCAQPCPITCLSLNYPTDCPSHLRCTEGCECQRGLVLSGTACVPIGQCGCTLLDGSYHPVGESWYSDRTCNKLCTCSSHNKVSCSHVPCNSSRYEMCIQHDGLQTCRRTGMALCHVSAYPHYVSFDDSYHSFRGTCTYILAHVCLPTMALFSFKITAKNEKWGSQTPLVYVSQVNIYLFSARVTLEKDHRVLIDGRQVSLPARTQIQGVSITAEGLYTVFTTNFGLSVKFDGRHLLEIQVPQSNYNRLCGLCGNFNGEKDDELLMPNDELARNDIEFGNSWKEKDDTDPDCQPDNRDQLAHQVKLSENCNPVNLARAQLHCQAAFQNPSWGRCASLVPSRPFLFGCIHSFCELGDLKWALCDSLQNFEAACWAHGLRTPNWRNSSFCPLKCPAHSSYTSCAPSCQPSCEDPEGLCLGSKRPSTCFEGCTCHPGYVLNEDECMPRSQCSCRDAQGTTFTVGKTWLSPNCTKSCTCTRGHIQCRNFHCPFGAHCQLISKSRSNCVPDWLDYCAVFGDPHYRTFDGVTYHFGGSMTYVLIKTVNRLPTGMEALLVEGRNKMYLPWSPVYLHEVFVKVYSYRVQLGPGLELVVNGEKMAIPFRPNKHLQVSLRAHRLYLTTDFKLGISFDGSESAVFSLPSTYHGLVHGLCGNFDRNTLNEYMMPNGIITTSSKIFGNSWEVQKVWAVRYRFPRAVQEEEKEEEGQPGFQVSRCSPEQLERVNTTQACRVLVDPQGPFAACHQTVAPEPFQEHCVFDLCAARNPSEQKKMRCQILGGYATLCQEAGTTLISWRNHTHCALACPANTVYQGCMTPCPASCASPLAPGDCEGPCVEGCASIPGYIYSGTQSLPVTECGCTSNGSYYQRGDSFVTRDCSQRCTCVSLGVLQCEPFSCRAGEICTVANLTRGCFRESSCLQNPCQNDGRCQEHGANFTCECELGYTGALCTEPWDIPPPGKPEASNIVAILLGMLVPMVVTLLAVTRERLHRKRRREQAQSWDQARLVVADESLPHDPGLWLA